MKEPRPLVEEHYHVNELIELQQKRSEDRTRHQEIEKSRDGFIKAIAGFKDLENLDFYCDKCQVDFQARAHKQIDSWGEVAYYKIKHSCGKWCMRHITDRFQDAYFFHSPIIARQRGEHHNDLLQGFETGYNMLYKK